MFDKEASSLLMTYFSLLERIKKGEQIIAGLTVKEGEDYDKYTKQLRYLKGAAFRASACIDILSGDVVLIGEQGGSLVIAKSWDEQAKKLAEKAKEYGGFVTQINILEKET